MVEMPMAEDHGVDLGWVDLHQFQVVQVDVGGKAVVKQIAFRFAALCGLDVESEAPFAFERLALGCRGKPSAGDGQTGTFNGFRKILCWLSVISRTTT